MALHGGMGMPPYVGRQSFADDFRMARKKGEAPGGTERSSVPSPGASTRRLRVDRDLPRLLGLALGDDDLEHAVLAAGLDGLGIHRLRQREAAQEAAGHALDAARIHALLLDRLLAR